MPRQELSQRRVRTFRVSGHRVRAPAADFDCDDCEPPAKTKRTTKAHRCTRLEDLIADEQTRRTVLEAADKYACATGLLRWLFDWNYLTELEVKHFPTKVKVDMAECFGNVATAECALTRCQDWLIQLGRCNAPSLQIYMLKCRPAENPQLYSRS